MYHNNRHNYTPYTDYTILHTTPIHMINTHTEAEAHSDGALLDSARVVDLQLLQRGHGCDEDGWLRGVMSYNKINHKRKTRY
jgi:hypothetical protein